MKENPSNTPQAGEILAGKYRVDRLLGAGSSGIVLAVTHLDLKEPLAVKLLRPDLAAAPVVERFLREARALVKLRGEHVVDVFDVGRLECGAPYIAMELLQGEDLAETSKRLGPLPFEDAVHYIAQASAALKEAHALGIVHRDLKPANLFLTRRAGGSPCIKVLDFGISKQLAAASAGDVEMTRPGDVMGSPLYMAPEQMISAHQAEPRSDIWSLGAILFKLVTGRAPFQAPTVPEIFAAALDPKPAPRASTFRPDIPSRLDDLIAQCLEKNLTKRPASVDELRNALLAGHLLCGVNEEEDPLGKTIPLNSPHFAIPAPPPVAKTDRGTTVMHLDPRELPPTPALPSPPPPRPSMPSADFKLQPPPAPGFSAPLEPRPSFASNPAFAPQAPAMIPVLPQDALRELQRNRARRLWMWMGGGAVLALIALAIGAFALARSAAQAKPLAAQNGVGAMLGQLEKKSPRSLGSRAQSGDSHRSRSSAQDP